MINKRITSLITAAVIVWMSVIVASGAGWNPFSIRWSFANPGAFGDSFGPLSAVMAAIAAISAFNALKFQQVELSRVMARESEQDIRNMTGDFERTFFQLLDHHRAILDSIDVVSNNSSRTGQDAFRSIIISFEHSAQVGIEESWTRTYQKFKNDLAHYFRFLYHIIKYVDNKSNIDNYFYIRIVRATLSESELFALALNCIWGEGKEKFKPLVEKYALLNNLSSHKIDKYKLGEHFDSSAFVYVGVINK